MSHTQVAEIHSQHRYYLLNDRTLKPIILILSLQLVYLNIIAISQSYLNK